MAGTKWWDSEIGFRSAKESVIEAKRKSNGKTMSLRAVTAIDGIASGMTTYYLDEHPVSVTRNEDGTYTFDDTYLVIQEKAAKAAKGYARRQAIIYALIGICVISAIIYIIVKHKK